jgi:hypothetical protein
VISSESKRNGRVEVIETVIRHMEAGMERWGVPVPNTDEEERTELALSFDDAEFQHDPGAADGATGSNGAAGPAGADSADDADGAAATSAAATSAAASSAAADGAALSQAHLPA